MRKILLLSSLLVILMFLVSCAPQITDEELEAELAKLTPEQREALLKDLENKKEGALAGQAVSAKYGISPKVVSVPASQIKQVVRKLENKNKFGEASGGSDILLTKASCADTDPQNDAMVLGKVIVNVSLDSFDKAVEYVDFCTDYDMNAHKFRNVTQLSCSPLTSYAVIEQTAAIAAGESAYNGSCIIEISPPDNTFLGTQIRTSTCKTREVFVKNLPSMSTNCEQLLGGGSYCEKGICVQQFLE